MPNKGRRLVCTDLAPHDLKLMDDAAHRPWVGAFNRSVLENAARLAGRQVQVRAPLIPGITTDAEPSLRAIHAFVREVRLPHSETAGPKYRWLDRSYTFAGVRRSPQVLVHAMQFAQEYGVEATIG